MNRKEGILVIGDPHLSDRSPGFRKDDYTAAILEKVRYALEFASQTELLPVFLGDLFHYPRDNSNRLLTSLIRLFSEHEVCGIYGNHDTTRNEIEDDDSLILLHSAGCYHLLDRDGPWCGLLGDVRTVIGGTSWGNELPVKFDPEHEAGPGFKDARVIWITHHDLQFPGYDDRKARGLKEIPGITAVFNGHLHRPMESVPAGATTWHNPGNISRITRSEASRVHVPKVTEARWDGDELKLTSVPLPAADFDDAFHEGDDHGPESATFSETVELMSELTGQRTDTGAGLETFLQANLEQFDSEVREDIMKLKNEVLNL